MIRKMPENCNTDFYKPLAFFITFRYLLCLLISVPVGLNLFQKGVKTKYVRLRFKFLTGDLRWFFKKSLFSKVFLPGP